MCRALWLEKQRYARVVHTGKFQESPKHALLPSKRNPAVKRWQLVAPAYQHGQQPPSSQWQPLPRVKAEEHHYERAPLTYLSYPHHNPEIVELVLDGLPREIVSHLATDIALGDDARHVYVSSDYKPLFARGVTPDDWETYLRDVNKKLPNGARKLDLMAAVGYWLGLSGVDDEFLRGSTVYVGLGNVDLGAGGGLFGAKVAADYLSYLVAEHPERVDDTLTLIRTAFRNALKQTRQITYQTDSFHARLRNAVEEVLTVLNGDLQGAWENVSYQALHKILGSEKTQRFINNIKTIAEALVSHYPELESYLLSAVGEKMGSPEEYSEEDSGISQQLQRMSPEEVWAWARHMLWSGSRAPSVSYEKPTLIDLAQHMLGKAALSALIEPALDERVLDEMPPSLAKEIVRFFKDALNQPIPTVLRDAAKQFVAEIKPAAKEFKAENIVTRAEDFASSRTWGDVIEPDPIAFVEAFTAYLVRLGELASAFASGS